jgi:low affinity Fe/Cu permease
MAASSTNSAKSSSASAGVLHRFNRALERFSHHVTDWVGSSWAFGLALLVIVVWAVTGPIFNYNETWQLIINTGTTIVTFLMVFLIQRSQNKESLAVEVKLNELLAAQQGASNELINAEDLSEEEIRALHKEFSELSKKLQAATDDCNPHSIAEAHTALHRTRQSLADRQEEREDEQHASNGKKGSNKHRRRRAR